MDLTTGERPMGGDEAPLSEAQMDAYATGSAFEPSGERPFEADPPADATPAPAPTPAPQPAAWEPDDRFFAEVPWGKEKRQLKGKDGYSKLVQWASMGHAYGENQRALKAREAALAPREQELTELQKYYKDIDAHAKANPAWWTHVQQAYQQRQGFQGDQGGAPADPSAAPASQPDPQLRAALERIDKLESRLKADVEKSEDAQLDEHIRAFKSEASHFDWETADESGLLLEDQIVAHAAKHGINNFRAAARDYLFDKYLDHTRLKAKEEVGETLRRNRGADGKFASSGAPGNPAPRAGLRPPQNLRDTSYEDLIREGLAELGVSH